MLACSPFFYLLPVKSPDRFIVGKKSAQLDLSNQRNIPLRRQSVSGPAKVVIPEIPVATHRHAPAIFSVFVHEPLHDWRYIPKTVRIGQKQKRFLDYRILADFNSRQL